MLLRTVSFLNPEAAASIQDTLKGGFQRGSNGLWFIAESSKWRSQFTIPFKGADILKEFTDTSVLAKLEVQDAILNWDAKFVRLHPLTTASDNNCLCHGVCYTLTGAQDRNYLLRNAIESIMSTDSEACRWFRGQWKKAIVQQDVASFGMEIERSPEQWDEEWLAELKLVQDRSKSLTEIHVLVLAHVVRRPIIVYSPQFTKDVDGNPLAPIYFGGIYLPLLWEPSQLLSRTPLLLAYNDSHFTALIPEVTAEGQVAPLADKDGHHFPIKFMDGDKLPPGGPAWLQQVRRYLDVATDAAPCISAKISKGTGAEFVQDLVNYAKGLLAPKAEDPPVPAPLPLPLPLPIPTPMPMPEPVAMFAKPFRTPRKAESADVAPSDDDIPQAQVAGVYVARSVKAGQVKVGKVELQPPPPGAGEAPPPEKPDKAGKWACPRCGIQNPPGEDECSICGTEREGASGEAKSRPPELSPVVNANSPTSRQKSPAIVRNPNATPIHKDPPGPKGQLYSNAFSPRAKKAGGASAQPAVGKAVKTAARQIPQSPAKSAVDPGTIVARPKAPAVATQAPAPTAPRLSQPSLVLDNLEPRGSSPPKIVARSPAKMAPSTAETPFLPSRTDERTQSPAKARAPPIKTEAVDPLASQVTPKSKIAVPFQVGMATTKLKSAPKARQAQEASVSVVTSGKAKLHVEGEDGPRTASPTTHVAQYTAQVTEVPARAEGTPPRPARVEATPPLQRRTSAANLLEPPQREKEKEKEKDKEKISVPFHVGIAAVKFKAGVRTTPQRSSVTLSSPSHGRAQLHMAQPNGVTGAEAHAPTERTPSPLVAPRLRPEIPLLPLGNKEGGPNTSPWLAAIDRSPRVTPVRVSSSDLAPEPASAAAPVPGNDAAKSPRGAVRAAGVVRPAWPLTQIDVASANNRSSPAQRSPADATQGWPAAVTAARVTPRSAYPATMAKPVWGAATAATDFPKQAAKAGASMDFPQQPSKAAPTMDFPQQPTKVGAWKLPPAATTGPPATKSGRDISPANWGPRK